MAAQDPLEPFDLVDPEGKPTGRTKPRREVHADGDWHRSLHLWVLLDGGALVFQRRSLAKDTWPGAIDVAVTGHLRAGEGRAEALREAEEEIGLPVRPEQVIHLGTRWKVDEHRPGICDREVQDILLFRGAARFEDLRPSPEEVTAVLALPFADALALFQGTRASVEARELAAGGHLGTSRVTLADFVGAPDGYLPLAAASVAAVVAGSPSMPWRLGGPAAAR